MAPSSKETAAAASPKAPAAKGTDVVVGWTFWATLCILASSLTLVNQLENPFARTLISCDVPLGGAVNNTEAPLSTKCSDRLLVTGAGARLSARAQSLEHFCKIFMALLTANIANIFGRRPLVLVAIGSVWISVFLFFLAGFFEGWAPHLFIIAQGIQGLAAGEMLYNIVFTDLATKMGAAGGSELYVKKDQLFGMVMFSTYLFSQFIAGLELLDYRLLWFCALCMLAIGAYMCALYFPETMTEQDEEITQTALSQRIFDELKLYKTMVVEKPIVFWCIFDAFLSGLAADSAGAMWAPLMIAYFGYTQSQLVLRVVPLTFMHEACKGWANDHCKKVGYVRGFYHVMLAVKCAGFTIVPLSLLCWWMQWVTKVLFMPLGGFGPVWAMLRARLVGEKMTPKLESLQFLVWCGGQAIGSQMHAFLFNEFAKTGWDRLMSGGLYMGGLSVATTLVFALKIYPSSLEALASMDAELAASSQSAAMDEVKLDVKKKD